ncbi:MAG: TadE/TadG family type IV pilus assembly protein [Sphingopyxis solisilvae]|uniref:TadE/TadG family type IV pilus assembly protein n=1 Tax=Sphingopyxis solisilvae TaxID=1886788 RepID=UPI0040357488
MTARIAHRLRRIRAGIVRLARDSGAVVMIEMAFCIPFLILVGFAGIELANLTLTHTRVSQIGLSAADNASRIAFGSNLSLPRVREVDINEVFVGVEQQAQGMDFRNNGRIILSSLERNADGGQWIHWQRCYGNLPITSAYGPQGTGATGTGFPGMGRAGAEVTAADGTAVMFVEIIYDYQPMIGATWFGTPRIRSTAAFNIREGRDLSQVYNPAPTAPVSNCS